MSLSENIYMEEPEI